MARCPICRKAEASAEHRPFCSQRCADVDLQGWLGGKYVVASDETVSRDSASEDDDG